MNTQKVEQLAKEYKADPNCWPALWIAGKGLTVNEELLFLSLVRQ